MKLLIVGAISINEFDLSPYISRDVDVIISGGAKGLDILGERYADLHRISKHIIQPRYDLYARSAPLRRSEKMVDMADSVLVIWDGNSRGAYYTTEYIKKCASLLL